MGAGRERSNREREDTKARKPRYERILIVCEGLKTEPNYFDEIRQHLRLGEIFIKVTHCLTGTTPLQVVSFLEKLLTESRRYDWGFCVFDRDEHPGYADAIAKSVAMDGKYRNDEGRRIGVSAIYSNPCFELWILSHFDARVTRHIERSEALSLVASCIPGYTKGGTGVFEKTRGSLNTAYEHAIVMRKLCDDRSTDNPQTMVDVLVKKLMSQKHFDKGHHP